MMKIQGMKHTYQTGEIKVLELSHTPTLGKSNFVRHNYQEAIMDITWLQDTWF